MIQKSSTITMIYLSAHFVIMISWTSLHKFDETGMPLDPSPPVVVARCGQKHPSAVGSGDMSQIMVLSCCSAAGYALPPFVIFHRRKLNPELTIGEVPGTVYGLSKRGVKADGQAGM